MTAISTAQQPDLPALELARQLGYAHLLLPGTPSTRAPRVKLTLTGPASSKVIDEWENRYRDREILWLVRAGDIDGQQLGVLDTDIPLAGVLAEELLPYTGWTVSTKSPGAYHRYYRLTDPIEEYEDRGTLDPIDLKAGWTEYMVAPRSPGYAPEPGFGVKAPAELSAKQWNAYIRHMKTILPSPNRPARLSDRPPSQGDGELCPNASLARHHDHDHYRCRGDSASSWRNFLRNVCARFVYRRWLSEGHRTPTFERAMSYMSKVHDNNRCHEHYYDRLNELVERTWLQSCQRASDQGYRESQRRKGRLRAEQLWAPLRKAIADRNRSIIADLNAGLSTNLVARSHGVCRRTVQRIAPPLLRPPPNPVPHRGG